MKLLQLLLLLSCLQLHPAVASQKEVACLTVAIYKEARGESEKGQYAVAQVIMNRARHFYYPPSVCKVVKQKHQFSWYKGDTPEFRKLIRGDLRGFKSKDISAYQKAKQIALRAFYGLADPIPALENSLWFTTKDIRPGWSRKLKVVARIGGHVFYAKR